MKYIEGQIEVKKAYIALWQTKILSGHYKTAAVYHGTEPIESKRLTEEELLERAMSILGTHVDDLRKLIEHLSTDNQ